jgi:hypothetical protein
MDRTEALRPTTNPPQPDLRGRRRKQALMRWQVPASVRPLFLRVGCEAFATLGTAISEDLSGWGTGVRPSFHPKSRTRSGVGLEG